MKSWAFVGLVTVLSVTILIGLYIVKDWGKPYKEVCSKTDEQKAMESATTMCKGKVASFHIDNSSNPIVECL